MEKKTFIIHFVSGETLTIPDINAQTFDNIAIGSLIKVGNRRILTSNITYIEEYEQSTSQGYHSEDDEEDNDGYMKW